MTFEEEFKPPFEYSGGDYVIITRGLHNVKVGNVYTVVNGIDSNFGLDSTYCVLRGDDIRGVYVYQKNILEFEPAKFTKSKLWKVLNEE